MPTKILMPALSPTMEKGNLAKWLKKEGDKVAPGDIIAEIETDKATMEVEAVDEGTLGKILIDEGTNDVPVNQPIAVLLGEGEDASAADDPDAGFVQPATRPADKGSEDKTAAQVTKQSGAPAATKGGQDSGAASPQARAPEQTGGEAGPVKTSGAPGASGSTSNVGTAGPAGYGGAGELREAAQAGTPPGRPSPARGAAGGRDAAGEGRGNTEATARSNGQGRIFASPLARRLAQEAGVEIGRVQGSGPHGRIIARDIEEAKSGKGLAPAAAPSIAPAAPAAAPVAQAPSDDKIRALFADGSYEVVPHDNMRRVIAQRLTEARRTVPQFYLTMDCEIDALLSVREQINAAAPKDKDGKATWKVSVNDMVVKALAMALMRVPDANVTWTERAMLKHKHADVGVAVALPGNGLITPIIRAAETKTLSTVATEMRDYGARAKARKLKPEEYQGGTTAVSNLGMFGIKDFTAVINPPHSTILAVGAGQQRAVVRNGQLGVATIMSATLSCDHRAVDGALGARLIGAFKELVESPIGMLV